MTNEVPPNDMRNLWQNQNVEHVHMPIDEIRKRARKFQRRIGWRNLREYAAAGLVVAFFAFSIWRSHDVYLRVGGGLVIASMLYVAGQLYRRGSARTVPADMALTTCLAFHRGELERQRDLLSSVWRWYLGPMIPGLAVLALGAAIVNPGHLAHVWRYVAAYAALTALAFFLIGRWNQRWARKLQLQIDALDALEKESK